MSRRFCFKALLVVIGPLLIGGSLISTRLQSGSRETTLKEAQPGQSIALQWPPANRDAEQLNSRPKRKKLLDQVFPAANSTKTISAISGLYEPKAEASARRNERESDPEGDAQRTDNPDAALRFRLLTLKDENGYIPPDGLLKAHQHIQVMKAAKAEKLEAEKAAGIKPERLTPGSWFWVGPGRGMGVGGRIRSIVIDPTNANSMFVGSVSGGIWHSIDAGASWQPVDDFMADLAVSTMVMDPTNAAVLYAGTGEGLWPNVEDGTFTEGVRGAGVFKSTDGGVTWNQLPNTNPVSPTVCGGGGANCGMSYVNRLAVSPDGSTLLAATGNGVWRSSDRGGNWTSSQVGIPNPNPFFDVDFDPGNNQRAILGGAGIAAFSTDGGATWNTAAFNPTITPVINPGPPPQLASPRVELAFAPSNASIVYATVDLNNGDLYRSTDGGQTYNRVNTGTSFFVSGAGDQGGYDNIVWVNPQDPTFVVVGGIDLFRSTDCGTINPATGQVQCNFTQISTWPCGPGQPGNACSGQSAHADQHMIVAHPGFNNTTNKVVYFGNDGGLFRADDVSTVTQTSGWVNLNNKLGITQFEGAACNDNHVATGDPFDFAPLFIGGAQDNGTVMSENSGPWTTVFGGDGGFVAIDPFDWHFIYGEYPSLQVFRSTDGGATPASYIYCNPAPSGGCVPGTGITDAASANFVAPMILDPNNSNTMLAGALSLWRTNDIKNTNPAQNNGLPTWTAIKSPDPIPKPPPKPPAPNPISAIAVAPGNSNMIAVGHNNGDIFVTFDGGANWPKINNGTPGRFVTRLVIDSTRSPAWIYATFGGFAADNIYRTTDSGVTWTAVTGTGATALPSVPVRSLAINPFAPNFLYAGTEVGVFVSTDGGANWELPQDGPSNVSVDELFWVTTRIVRLVAATWGRGIYEAIGSQLEGYYCLDNSAANTCNSPPPPPPTGPYWDERGNWPNCTVPTANDDVNIGSCGNMTIRAGTACRNLTVAKGATLTINASLSVLGSLTNNGTITIDQPTGLNITGNVTNNGTINGAGFIVTSGVNTSHHFSGTGTFGGLSITDGHTVLLDSDVTFATGQIFVAQTSGFSGATSLVLNSHNLTFGGTNFINSSIVDLGTGNLNFNGTDLFQSYDGGTICCNPYGILGTGNINIQPSDGTANLAIQSSRTGTFQPSLHIISGTINANVAETIGGSLTVDSGATLDIQQGGLTVNGNMTINGATTDSTSSTYGSGNALVFNGGTFTNNGSISIPFVALDTTGASLAQDIVGTGSWSGTSFTVGNGSSTVLRNDVTLNYVQLQPAGLDLDGHTLIFTGNLVSGGSVSGTGTFKLQPSSGSLNIASFGSLSIAPAAEFVSGTARIGSANFTGPLKIDAGATVNNSSFGARNNVTINGALTNSNAFFSGDTLANNGSVDSTYVNFGPESFGSPIVQNLSGTGNWTGAGSGRLLIDQYSTTNLLNDVTYAGAQLSIYGQLNTGAFTLTVPCTVPWDTFGSGNVVGNLRRTNLSACAGPIAFGNPFTTIAFTSGTPPSEVTVNILLASPPNFGNAVRRTYTIGAVGGSGWTATLRLHYEDSELNGNNESTLQLYRNNGSLWNAQGATARDTTNNWVEYAGVTQFSPWTLSSTVPTATDGSVSGRIADDRGNPIEGSTIHMSGTQDRLAITDNNGNYRFDEVETNGFYTITPSRANYSFSPASRSFSLLGVHTDASFTATPNRDGVNAIDTTEFFVRQQYLDFLGREPDPPGFAGWTSTINNCSGDTTQCDRIHVSQLFFQSQEFQERGYFVYRFYNVAFGRKLDYVEFVPDLASVSGFLDANQLEAAKVAFIAGFMARAAFANKYDGLTNQQYVNMLLNTAGVTLSNRQTMIDGLNAGTLTRAQVLRQIVECSEVSTKYNHQAYAVMEYFGYLRRDPDALYLNWIQVLDQSNDPRAMVTGFVNSAEYRQRFGP